MHLSIIGVYSPVSALLQFGDIDTVERLRHNGIILRYYHESNQSSRSGLGTAATMKGKERKIHRNSTQRRRNEI